MSTTAISNSNVKKSRKKYFRPQQPQQQLKMSRGEIKAEKSTDVILIDNVWRRTLGIIDSLKEFGGVSTLDFHPHMRYCLITQPPHHLNGPQNRRDDVVKLLREWGYDAKRLAQVTDAEWKSLNTEVPVNGIPPEYVGWYRLHYYLSIPSKSLDDQLRQFLTHTQIEPAEIEEGNLMLDELQKILPFGQLHPFGSTYIGIANLNSDLDVNFQNFDTTISKVDVLKNIKKAIDKAGPEFGWIEDFLHAKNIRVPLLKFVHAKTNIQVDISCENLMSVQNSKLIKFLCTLDPIVKPLLIFMKNWAQFHYLIAPSNGGLKSYAISLLVIVFLVQKKVLPSVQQLQSLAKEPMIIKAVNNEEWNIAFCDDKKTVENFMFQNGLGRTFKNDFRSVSMIPFVLEFFEMLSKFSGKSVVCFSSTGIITSDPQFLHKQNEAIARNRQKKEPPKETDKGKQPNKPKSNGLKFFPLNIQDPFDLTYNVSKGVTYFTLRRLLLAARETLGHVRRVNQKLKGDYKLTDFFRPLNQKPNALLLTTIQIELEKSTFLRSRLKICDNEFPNFNLKRDSTPSYQIIIQMDEKFKSLFLTRVKPSSAEPIYDDKLVTQLMTRYFYRAIFQFFTWAFDLSFPMVVDKTNLRLSTSKQVSSINVQKKKTKENPFNNFMLPDLEKLVKEKLPLKSEIQFEFTVNIRQLENVQKAAVVKNKEKENQSKLTRNDLNYFVDISCNTLFQWTGDIMDQPSLTVTMHHVTPPFSSSILGTGDNSKIQFCLEKLTWKLENDFYQFSLDKLRIWLTQSSRSNQSQKPKGNGKAKGGNRKPKMVKNQTQVPNKNEVDSSKLTN